MYKLGSYSSGLSALTLVLKWHQLLFILQQISLRLTYKLLWPEPRMILNSSADWSEGEINVRGDMVDNFWTPDIIIHDLGCNLIRWKMS